MKPRKLIFSSINNQNQPQKWESSSRSIVMLLGWRCWSALLSLPGVVRKKVKSLNQIFAGTVTRITLAVFRHLCHHRLFLKNKRHVVGFVMLGAGVLGYFAGSLFFSPTVYEHGPCQLFGVDQCFSFETGTGWCLMSWFIYLDNVGWAVSCLFLSFSIVFLIPRNGLHVALAAPVLAIGLTKLIHVSFFARSFETYTAFPDWQIVFAAVMLAIGVVLSADYMVHAYNHRTLAFEKRLLTMYNGADLVDDATFKGLFKKFIEEKKAFQKQY